MYRSGGVMRLFGLLETLEILPLRRGDARIFLGFTVVAPSRKRQRVGRRDWQVARNGDAKRDSHHADNDDPKSGLAFLLELVAPG